MRDLKPNREDSKKKLERRKKNSRRRKRKKKLLRLPRTPSKLRRRTNLEKKEKPKKSANTERNFLESREKRLKLLRLSSRR